MRVFLLLLLCVQLPLAADSFSLEKADEFKLPSFPEPSGLCFSSHGKTLFVVGDEGHIGEVDRDGELLRIARLGRRDFEGIAADPDGESLYALDEQTSQILIVETESFSISGVISLPFVRSGPFEGLSMDENGHLILANQILKKKKSDAAVFIYDPMGSTPESFPTGIVDQSAVHWAAEKVYVLSDTENRLYCYSRDGEELWHCKTPGKDQEGIAVDETGGLIYIAQDSGGILKLRLERKEM